MSPRVLTDLQREKHRLVRCFSRHESLPHKELAAQPQFWQVHVASHSVTHLNEGSWGVLITKKAPEQVLLKMRAIVLMALKDQTAFLQVDPYLKVSAPDVFAHGL